LVKMDMEEDLKKSKSQVKRELLALQDLGREMAGLSTNALDQLPISDAVRHAVVEARQLKMAALARHLKHVGKLLRYEDVDAIKLTLTKIRLPRNQEVNAFHEVESWRDRLLAGEDAVMDDLRQRFADIDWQHLRQLVRNAKKEENLGKAPKSARLLFRYLKGLNE
jgi:ribosome-associated protein